MSLSYANEKFSNAVRSLATSPSEIHGRLIEATIYHISHVDSKRDMPVELQDRFDELMDNLTKEPIGEAQIKAGEGKIHASVQKLSTEEAVEAAEEIVALFHVVQDIYKAGPIG